MKHLIPCEMIRDILPSYVDGRTHPDTNVLINQHLDDCGECRLLYQNAQQTAEGVISDNGSKELKTEVPFRKDKKRKKYFLRGFLTGIVSLMAVLLLYVFIIGQPADMLNLHYTAATINGQYVFMYVPVDNSKAVSYEQYREDGDTLYIKIRVAHCSPLHPHTKDSFYSPETGTVFKTIILNGAVIWENGEPVPCYCIMCM